MTIHTARVFNETAVRIPRKKIIAAHADLARSVFPLNVIGVGNGAARRLNRTYRGKDAPASVLAFPAENGVAEIYLNMHRAKKTAKDEDVPLTTHLLFLCVHGMLHLLGHRHGPTMESLENEYATTYMYASKAGKRRHRYQQQHDESACRVLQRDK